MKLLTKIFNILDANDKFHFFTLLFAIFISMILEMLGIGLIIPILTLVVNGSESFSSNYNFVYLNDFLLKDKESQITIILIIFVLIYLIKSIYLTFMTFYLNYFCYSLKAKLSKNLFKSYLNKKFKFYIDNNSAMLLRNIKDEPDLFVIHVFKPLLLLFVDCFLVVGVIAVLIFYEPLISSFLLIMIIIIGSIFIKLISKQITQQGLSRQKNDASRIKIITQAFNSIVEIMILNVKKTILEKYIEPNNQSAKAVRIHTVFLELPRVWLEMITVSGILIVTLTMIQFKRDIQDIIPVLGLFSLAAFRTLPVANRILASLTSIKFAIPVIKIIQKNLQKNLDIKDKMSSKNIVLDFNKDIYFKNVSFNFITKNIRKKIFNDFDLRIKKNSSIAIVGESGSGKSTLLNLLLGFFDPSSGKIFIDNKNLKYLKYEWLSKIGYVSQMTNIIDDTVKRNIAFGQNDHEIDQIRLWDSIEKSNLTKFVNQLPKGLNTFLGERGVKISGGQRQRISIARALYHNPSVIIFDEATNALDIATENNIINEILKLKKEKTLIFVTHRINNLKKFDAIYEISRNAIKRKII